MRRALSLVGVAALAVALAGCSAEAGNGSVAAEGDKWSLGGALGATGGILLIPLVVLAIIAGLITSDHDAYSARWLWTATIVLGVVIITLWITATWMGGIGR